MILPWQVDVPQDNRPVANWLIVLACIVVFFLQIPTLADHVGGNRDGMFGPFDAWILTGWNLKGLLGHMWLHGSFFHLFGNMWFLWVFGNAVCANVGNLRYPLVYITLGVAAGITHLMVSSHPVLGASGAINGIVGMYLVMFPLNEITCYFFIWFVIPYLRQFAISGYWLILFWLFWDILGATRSSDSGVAYFAHLGGFATGVGMGVLFCAKGWCLLDNYDRSLVQILQDRKKSRKNKSVVPAHLKFGLPNEDLIPSADVTTPEPIAPELLSIPMLNLNDGTLIPGSSSGLICVCGERIMVSERYEGKTVCCPRCKTPIEIPSDLVSNSNQQPKTKVPQVKKEPQSGMIRFVCSCGQKIKIPARYGGRFGKCPRCNGRIQIPSQ